MTTFSRPQVWVLAARPKTLPAALGPVVVGSALAAAADHFRFGPALAALLVALLLQIGSNLANDYFDFFRGADQQDRLGPLRVTASGLIAPATMKWGMVVVFGSAALIGLYLLFVGGWPVALIGVSAILAALAYTGGPLPFGYYGLGDLFVFLFFGLVAVGGTYYVQALTLTPLVLWAAVPPGLLITAILVVNNLRDLETDRRAHKRTLAVFIGAQATRYEYLLLLSGAYLVVLGLWGLAGQSAWILLPLLTVPLAIRLTRTLWRANTGPVFNATLAGTAQLSFLFSLLLAVGLLIA